MRTPRATATITAALALACALVLAGCTGDDEPQEPESTWTPTSTPEAPSTSPAATPTRPALPDEAKKATPAGARAFIEHYWAVANYAQATGNIGQLHRLQARTCKPCMGVASDIRRHYMRGGHITGGENVPKIHSVKEVESDTGSLYAFQAQVQVVHGEQTIHQPDGSISEQRAGTNHYTMYVAWVDDARWRLEHMELE